MSDYESKVYDAAKLQGLTVEQIRQLNYQQVAELAGITIGKKGESPSDFFYQDIRKGVAGRMGTERRIRLQKDFEAGVQSLVAEHPEYAEAAEIVLKTGSA